MHAVGFSVEFWFFGEGKRWVNDCMIGEGVVVVVDMACAEALLLFWAA
jgi:hypothetical protein